MSFFDDLLSRHPIPWIIIGVGLIAGFLTWILPRAFKAPTRFQKIRLLKAAAMGAFSIFYLGALVIVGTKLLTNSSTFLTVGLLLLFAVDWFSRKDNGEPDQRN